MLEAFATLLVLAILCEAVTEWLKGLLPLSEKGVQLLALAVGLLLAYGARQDLLALLGIEYYLPAVGNLFAGFVISRGANYIHDLVGKLTSVAS